MSETTSGSESFKLTLPVAIVVAGFVIAGAIVLTKGPAPAAADAGQGGTTNIAIRQPSAGEHIVGSPDAPVVLVEYADFQCPYCSLIYPTLKKIVADSNGKIAWVYRNLPLDSIHPNARPAAEAAECISHELGNDAFWKFSDDVFNNQQSLGDSFYKQEAAKLGADPQTFQKCYADKQYDSVINADSAEAVTNGGSGTPYTIVVGRDGTKVPFSGALPFEQVNSIVQAVLSKQK